MLEQLRKYIQETEIEAMKREWHKIEQLGFTGPNAFEYLEFLNENQRISFSRFYRPKKINVPKNMAPDFLGSFFLLNIAI